MPRKSSTSLTILAGNPSNKPFKSSRLAIPTSPFSPQYPITPLPKPARLTHPAPTNPTTQSSHCSPPPPNPLSWLWQCHVCHHTYRLGTTRRCLEDGHSFCSGTTVVKRGGKRSGGRRVVRHKACQSEFDYQGWKVWGTWRRRVEEEMGRMALREGRGVVIFGREKLGRRDSGVFVRGDEGKDCWNRCEYPSECRWGKRFGVRTPSPPPGVMPSSSSSIVEMQMEENVDIASAADASVLTAATSLHDDEAKKPSMDDLLASAKRRKRRSTGAAPSPLASSELLIAAEEMEVDQTDNAQVLQRSRDDSELDLRKSFSGLVSGLGFGRRGSAPSTTTDMGSDGEISKAGSWWAREKTPSRRAVRDM